MFITKLEIEKVRHLKNISIKLSTDTPPHLIFTGKNGSGKTSVLDAISIYLKTTFQNLDSNSKMQDNTGSSLQLFFNDPVEILKDSYANGDFLLAYYKCDRAFQAEVSEHVEKVSLSDVYNLTDSPRNLFVKYLVDLKVTEALAKAKSNDSKANAINNWFIQFEILLQHIFEDPTLKLEFNEDTFSFTIRQNGKEPYDFNCMSSGFSAVMDIILGLIIRIVKKKGRIFEFDLPGIVKGYFQVDTLSDTLKKKFQDYKALVHKSKLTDDDFEEIAELEMFLDEIPAYLAVDITTEYQQLKAELAQREDI